MARDGEVQLGDEARDDITGFIGVVIGVTKWLHGCRRITIQPRQVKDGKPVEPAGFDEPQVVVTKRLAHATTGHTGGPKPEPSRRHDVRRRT